MNAYEKAIALGLTGEPAEIVAKLQTLTVGPIPVANVLQWFDEQNLGELDAIENAWVGTLVDVVRNPQTPSPVAAGVRKLFAHLAKRTSQTVDTTDLEYSVDIFAMLSALIQMGVVTVDQRDSFYDLDGGRPFKDLTVEQFAEQKTAAETLVQANATTAASYAYLQQQVATRTSSRNILLAPIQAAQTRDDEAVRYLRDRIAVAARDSVSLLVTTEDVDAMLGGA